MLKTLLSKLSTLLQEVNGPTGWSSTRFAFLLAVIISNITLFVLICVQTFKTGSLPDVPEGILWIYALANGISFAGKVSQKFKETKTDTGETNEKI